MPVRLVVEQCAPTLAGLKTASLFNTPFEMSDLLDEEIEELNRKFEKANMKFMVLSRKNGRALIYLVRPDHLKKDLAEEEAAEILMEMGYDPTHPKECLDKLSEKLQSDSAFPHEIGLFLGYPAGDVKGFMENRPCKCYGVWKVYDNEAETMKKFAAFKKCTEEFTKRLSAGSSLEELAGIQKDQKEVIQKYE